MKNVKIRLLLICPMGNRFLLDVSNDEFGILKYSLYGEKNHVPNSLSNLQMTERFPDTIDDYNDVNVLATIISVRINTGVKKVLDVVYCKSN